MSDMQIIDSVESFASYTQLCRTLIYQYTRAEGFPKIQLQKKGKIMIPRKEAIEWLKEQMERNRR